MEEKEIKQLNIFEKMSLITDEMAVVEKGLKVEVSKNRSYNAVSERDILDNVKPLEKKYRVYSYPADRKVIDSSILSKKTEYGESTSLYMRLEITYRFVNIDNPSEYIDVKTYGDGIDTGDKATGKAMTYGDKYALMKAYKISTGDDPDKDASPEAGYKVDGESKINSIKVNALKQSIVNNNISDDELNGVLSDFKYKKVEDIKLKDFGEICNRLRAIKGV